MLELAVGLSLLINLILAIKLQEVSGKQRLTFNVLMAHMLGQAKVEEVVEEVKA